jgi:hypothetical protein
MEAAKRLQRSGACFDINVELVEMPDTGAWLRNAKQKARAVASVWEPGTAVVLFDADAIIHRDPEYLRKWKPELDFASKSPPHPRYRNTGCTWFGPRRVTKRLLRRWIRLIDGGARYEDGALQTVVDQLKQEGEFNEEWWPEEYGVVYNKGRSKEIDPDRVIVSLNEREHPAKRKKPRVVPMPPLPWEGR